ncbi:diguanylate cyclase [Bacterioplanes sanyensis]|uniref:diguanylate cyclase n=1 Tax=Bacterioplanes sanyensis TaxID=1249553 RepID=A0A222FKB9_9GAMM|nr:diguanylate cyclase [Bacterioplanes sanyensis]ASP39487.1 diguanylate cyclase [Bacterioplanes sanyensis]
MKDPNIELGDIHWLMDILQNIDVGLVVLDRDYRIQLWNGFMESHSGVSPQHAKEQIIFDLFDEIPRDWFMQKAEPVFQLKTRTFTIWEQRPYLFKFKNYRPITGRAATMYQNTSMIPLESINRAVDHICLIIYDVTDIAINRADAISANQSLRELHQYDHLTELFNRPHWEPKFAEEHQRSERTGQAASLVLIDVDNFRHINTEYGHQAGDEVLRTLAAALRQTLRQTDSACRFTGESFAVMLIGTDEQQAVHFAERIRKDIEHMIITVPGHEISVTVSIGIAASQPAFESAAAWQQAALRALNHAKDAGRNRTTLFQHQE